MESSSGRLNLTSDNTIPAAIWIGVTGHRKLDNEDLLRRSVKKVLLDLEKMIRGDNGPIPWTFIVTSSLAEGADRLVAEEVLKYSGEDIHSTFLEAVLPLDAEDYLRDFKTEESQSQFNSLLDVAGSVINLKATGSREDAYLKAGLYIVNRSDVLIAIWDGEAARGTGGTAEIIEYARKRKRVIFWIDSKSGDIKNCSRKNDIIRFGEQPSTSRTYLGQYNTERITAEDLKRGLKSKLDRIERCAKDAGMFPEILEEPLTYAMPSFVRATFLARRYQRFYVRSGTAICILSAAAVATVVIQVLFLESMPQILWVEVFWMVILITLVIFSEHHEWRRKWIDYRLLAELMRAHIYSSMTKGLPKNSPAIENGRWCCQGVMPIPISSFLVEDWRNWAFSLIILKQKWIDTAVPFESLKSFILKAWIDDQIRYYKETGERYLFKYKLLDRAGLTLFGLTLAAAVLHSIGTGQSWLHDLNPLPDLLTSVAIIFPAIGSSLAGIKMYREYLLNSKRYLHLFDQLQEIREEMIKAEDLANFALLVDIAKKTMLSEHLDWSEITEISSPPT